VKRLAACNLTPGRRVLPVKIFLYSLMLTDNHIAAISALCGKEPYDTEVSLIENAADVVTEGPDGWVDDVRDSIRAVGYRLKLVDLREHLEKPDGLEPTLSSSDVIWIGGGNMYYLRWLLMRTAADRLITEVVRKGTVYCGWSAGACVAGPTLVDGERMDDATRAREVVYEGLNLVDFVVIPHIDNDHFAEASYEWNNKLISRGIQTIPLKDDQGIVVSGKTIRII
jgi:dipeptidase E